MFDYSKEPPQMTRTIMKLNQVHIIWCVIFIIVTAWAGAAVQGQPAGDVKQSDLIAVLLSDAPQAEKAITCKRLAIYGGEEAVAALAPLLEDKELTSWARIALEAIPGPAADAALRNALGRLEGRLLVGVINSIGVRRDGQAVEALAQKLGDTNPDVASAAAVALGHIGGEQAGKVLTQFLAGASAGVRSAAAEGCILCAEGFLARDKAAEAATMYDMVRQADVPDQRRLEAIRGAILARQSAGIPLLLEQLRSEDENRFDIGLRAARELGGRDVTEALAEELARLSPDRGPLLLLALADRSDAAVLPIVLREAQNGPKDLRIAAIQILNRLGDVSCIPILLEAAGENDAELEQAAMETLLRLPGNEVDADLIGRLPSAEGNVKRVLIQLAGQRPIGEALAAVVPSLQDGDAGIRRAALQTVGILGQDPQTDDLVQLLLKTQNAEERADIEKALQAICGRCGIKCISHLEPLAQSPDSGLRIIGLHALAIVGGPEALAAVKSAMASTKAALQDEAVRILSTWPNNWPEDEEAGQALLVVVTSADKLAHKVLGLRGYLQYLRGNKKLSNEQKAARVEEVQSYIKRAEERQQAIAVLGEAPSAKTLELLTTFADTPAVAEEAYAAMVQIASQDISGISKEQRRQVLQRVIEKSKNDGIQQKAQETLGAVP